MKKRKFDLRQVHTACTNNGNAILNSETCGCFGCGRIFSAKEINSCIHELEGLEFITVICPYCHLDSVLPSYTLNEMGYELTQELINAMKREYFY